MSLLCTKCKEEKSEDRFGIVKDYACTGKTKPSWRNSRRSWCKACMCKAQMEHISRKDPADVREAKRATHYRSAYGISVAQYEKMFAAQGGLCYICYRPPKKHRLAVDHNHRTGQVRGLLCANCNRGLRWFYDDPVKLRKAAEYLDTVDIRIVNALNLKT